MKLYRSNPDHPARRGLHGQDVLGRPEPPPEDFFDIRKFLASDGVAYIKMMVTVVNPQDSDHELFLITGWTGNLDAQLGEQFQRVPGFKEYALKKITDGYENAADQGPIRFLPHYGLMMMAMQTFPELREEPSIKNNLLKEYPSVLESLNESEISAVDKLTLCCSFVMFLPEKKSELLTTLLRFFEEQPEKIISELTSQEFSLEAAVACLLVFPELRDQLKSLMSSNEHQLKQEWDAISKKRGMTEDEMIQYFGMAFGLSMITADNIQISPDGRIQFQLKPGPTTPPAPLPDRPLN